jgi:magnesium-transporting ATPase (P-type)
MLASTKLVSFIYPGCSCKVSSVIRGCIDTVILSGILLYLWYLLKMFPAGTLTDESIVFQGIKYFKDGHRVNLTSHATATPSVAHVAAAAQGLSEGGDGDVEIGAVVSVTHECPELVQIANELMSACHSLSIVEGHPAGDPLEVELFRKYTDICCCFCVYVNILFVASDCNFPCNIGTAGTPGWALMVNEASHDLVVIPPASQPNGGREHVILRQFEFSPEKLRAATLLARPHLLLPAATTATTTAQQQHMLLVKGSPEMVSSLCLPSSIPAGFGAELTALAKRGFRVLAVAYRVCTETREVINVKQTG